jgi:hypothetical protein
MKSAVSCLECDESVVVWGFEYFFYFVCAHKAGRIVGDCSKN